MYLTIQEAKEKKCVLPSSVAGMRSNCIAQDCMAWRQETRYKNPQGFEKYPTEKGYCGLVNKPD